MGRQKTTGMGWSEGWAGKEAPGSLRGRRVGWIWAAAVPPHAHTHSRPRPSQGCLQKEASSVVRAPQARRPPPILNEILVQSCRRWGRASEAPQCLCSRPKGA